MKLKCHNKKCKNTFEKRIHKFPSDTRREKNKFCSNKCALAVCRTRKHQIQAAKMAAKVIIEKYRGTGTKTYVNENGKHQHRVVMERHIGRRLKKGEIVHHIDRNKKNNEIKNLLLLKSQSEHFKLHRKEDL